MLPLNPAGTFHPDVHHGYPRPPDPADRRAAAADPVRQMRLSGLSAVCPGAEPAAGRGQPLPAGRRARHAGVGGAAERAAAAAGPGLRRGAAAAGRCY